MEDDPIKELSKLKSSTTLSILNVLMFIMVGLIAFMARDLYVEVRTYPNTIIQKKIIEMDKRLSEKSNDTELSVLAKQTERQYNLITKQLQRQNDKIDELNRFLRNDYYRRQ